MRNRKLNWVTAPDTTSGLLVQCPKVLPLFLFSFSFLLLLSGCDTKETSSGRSSGAISTSIAGIAGQNSNTSVVRIPADRSPEVPGPTMAIGFPVAAESLQANKERLAMKADQRYSASRWLHLMRALGPNVSQEFEGKTITGLELFTDAELGERYFGSPVFGRTRFGVRYRSSGKGMTAVRTQEVHRDQCLAVMAELDCPLSTELKVDGEKLHLVDALRDSVANFHLEQNELAWSGLAYALYLSPRKHWTNKFGDRFTFDEIVLKLLDQRLDNRACVGVHVVAALNTIYRIDTRQSPLLSEEVRLKLRNRLQHWLDAASNSQSPDGSWGVDWYREKPNHITTGSPMVVEQLNERLLATSHLVEWIMFSPEKMKFDSERLKLSAHWLDRTLKNLPEEMVRDHFCPVSHGTSSLELLSGKDHVALVREGNSSTDPMKPLLRRDDPQTIRFRKR